MKKKSKVIIFLIFDNLHIYEKVQKYVAGLTKEQLGDELYQANETAFAIEQRLHTELSQLSPTEALAQISSKKRKRHDQDKDDISPETRLFHANPRFHRLKLVREGAAIMVKCELCGVTIQNKSSTISIHIQDGQKP